jgi:hypothetical protein
VILLFPSVILVVAVAASSPASAQTVFRCMHADGKVAYQAKPCDQGVKQKEVRIRVNPPNPAAVPRKHEWKGYSPPKVAALTFYYDPAEEPVGFSTAQMEADIRAAIAAWMSGCDVRLHYGGRRPAQFPGTPEHVPIRWAPEYMRMAHPADSRSGVAGSGSLAGGIALKPRFHEAHMLSVLIHEMGHVLGLAHNHDDPQSVMSYLRDEGARRNPQPSPADFHACNLSMKQQFGIDYKPAADAPAMPQGRRMSDREALEKIHGTAPR